MEELVAHNPRSNHVRQRQLGGWVDGIPAERTGRSEGPERMCHLLLGHLDGHADTEQTVRYLQEHLPLCVSLPVVQEQQPEYLPTVPEQFCLCISALKRGFLRIRASRWLLKIDRHSFTS